MEIKAFRRKRHSFKESQTSAFRKGLHGGCVKIEADLKKSSKGNLVPIKPSIGGVKARRFLGFGGSQGKINSQIGGSSIKWEQWKALHNAIKDHGDGGQTRNSKAKVWESLDKLFLYCEKMNWTGAEFEDYKKNLDLFKKSMIVVLVSSQLIKSVFYIKDIRGRSQID